MSKMKEKTIKNEDDCRCGKVAKINDPKRRVGVKRTVKKKL